ncbi:MAG: sulfite exporter TauE/SafE family protein [Rhodobacteraceae bacterium]|nr:sulfite exporter TauE/SafE family protein [Paracoccaceae bacterium]
MSGPNQWPPPVIVGLPNVIGLVSETLAMPGLVQVLAITVAAGVVYGFAGFGAALVFMPVAIVFVPIEMAVAAFAISALASLVTVVPRAWKQADRRATGLMVLCAGLTLPVGIYILRTNDVVTMRWVVLAVTAITLVVLVSGWRYSAAPTKTTRAGVALATGLVGGATGLVGPIMVLFQLGGQDTIARSRANTMVFLTITSLLTAPMMVLQGMLTKEAVALGLILIVPYGLAARLGQALFDPARQRLYRGVAYFIIGAAIIMGLPVWT